jgi:hypothetical protein
VCGGAQGDGTGITSVAWNLYPLLKYKLPLGSGLEAFQLAIEPAQLSQTGVTADKERAIGTPILSAMPVSSTSASPTGSDFALNALPTTSVADHTLGFSDTTQLIYQLATIYGNEAVAETTAYRVFTSVQHTEYSWTLSQPRVNDDAEMGPDPYYVADLQASVGVSWIFTIHFDAPCKADGLSAVVNGTPWDPLNAPDRSKIQEFLVANKAVFKLHVLQTGNEDAGLRGALEGTTCTPSDLAACEAMFERLETERSRFMQTSLSDQQYGDLTGAGVAGPWVIGRIHAVPASVP